MSVGSGQWAVGSGQWAVGSGQWAVGSGQWFFDGVFWEGVCWGDFVRMEGIINGRPGAGAVGAGMESCSEGCGLVDKPFSRYCGLLWR
ncbi:hypothetical protein FEM03_05260 [Phragmitibacter flavus]|uniref:Uncharacterized protein n=1 Tax=Phragmitibacter flavus TaxID=2576071 RepID=A0A5R8KIJ0_9BACT|nr:hypothetical protein FEM03_05260 [Phragmitibacter flavus]